MNTEFYICRHCGNLVEMIHNTGVPVICCGEKMEKLVPNTVEAAGEKHVPALTKEGDTLRVNVGTVDHPMAEEHYIQWIALVTPAGVQRRDLAPGEKPEAVFHLDGQTQAEVYAYCNLHGLWMAKL